MRGRTLEQKNPKGPLDGTPKLFFKSSPILDKFSVVHLDNFTRDFLLKLAVILLKELTVDSLEEFPT